MTERAPLGPWQAVTEQNRVNRVGGARQLVANASPIPTRKSAVGDALAALAAVSDIGFKNDDIFTLAAAGAQTKTLTYPPIEQSLHVELNGLKATKTVDWTLSGNVLSLLTPLDCRIGDVLTTEYAYYTGVPATPTDAYDDTTYDASVLSDAPIAYWPMADTGTGQRDITSNGHNATVTGTDYHRSTASLLPTDTSNSSSFDGTAAYFSCPTSTAFDTSALTIEFWSNRGGTSSTHIYEHPGKIIVEVAGSGIGNVYLWLSGAWSLIGSSSGGWGNAVGHHFAVTYDGTTLTFWRDGAQFGSSVSTSHTIPAASGGPRFGAVNGVNTVETDKLQKVAVYGSVLSSTRLAAHYSAA